MLDVQPNVCCGLRSICLHKHVRDHVRMCVVQAGAAEKGVPVYKHLADLAGNKQLVRTLVTDTATQSIQSLFGT